MQTARNPLRSETLKGKIHLYERREIARTEEEELHQEICSGPLGVKDSDAS